MKYKDLSIRAVDFLWERKITFLLIIAALFFAIRGTNEAIKSITSLQPQGIQATTTHLSQ
jgi:hypothetical protein